MNIFDWINSDDGPKFDDDLSADHGPDDYAGVVRWDGKRKSRGDRDDLEEKREQDEIEESIKRIKRRQRDFDLLYQEQISKPTPKPRKRTLSDSGYGQLRDGETFDYAAQRKKDAERRIQTARDEAQRGNYGRNYDPISNTSPGYVAPHEHGQSGSGLAKFSLIIITILIVASAIFN